MAMRTRRGSGLPCSAVVPVRSLPVALVAVLLTVLAPASAGAAVLVPGASGDRLDALRGVVTWVQRDAGGEPAVMRFIAGDVSEAPRFPGRRGLATGGTRIGDLGLDRRGRVVLTVRTCGSSGCRWWAYRVESGEATRLRRLHNRRGCSVEAVSLWRRAAAVARSCSRHRRSRILVADGRQVLRSVRYRSILSVWNLDLSARWLAVGSDDESLGESETESGVHLIERRSKGCRRFVAGGYSGPDSGATVGAHPQLAGGRIYWASSDSGYLSASLRDACRPPVTRRPESPSFHSAVDGTTLYSMTDQGIEARPR